MRLDKFLKGSTTVGELENMPYKFINTVYKMYLDTLRDQKKKQALAAEETMDELEDAMT